MRQKDRRESHSQTDRRYRQTEYTKRKIEKDRQKGRETKS